MERYRCGRCQAVLAAVATPPGGSARMLLDPLVERRLLEAVAEHRRDCPARESTGHDTTPRAANRR